MNEIEIGKVLQEERTRQKISIEDAARHLNLSVPVLESLEKGLHDELPGQVFARGYIRGYARFLGINIDELLEKEEPFVVQSDSDDLNYGQDENILRLTRVWGSIAVLIVLLILVYGWWDETHDQPEKTNNAPLIESERMGSDPFDSTEPDPFDPPSMPSTPTPYEPNPTPPPVSEFPGSTQTQSYEAQATTPQQSDASTTTTIFENLVEIRIEIGDHESWIQVVDADTELLIERIFLPFESAAVYGTPPFDFRIGYVLGVKLFIDGESYDIGPHQDRGLAFFRAP